MSILDTFDGISEEILKPSCVASPVEGFPKTVIIIFESILIDILKASYPVGEISSMSSGFRFISLPFRAGPWGCSCPRLADQPPQG